jgi:GTP-binding protein
VMSSDLAVMELLDRAAVSYEMVLTKSDELAPGKIEAAQSALAAEAKKHTAALALTATTSALTAAGIPEFQSQLATLAH